MADETQKRYVLIEPDPFSDRADEIASESDSWDERSRKMDRLYLDPGPRTGKDGSNVPVPGFNIWGYSTSPTSLKYAPKNMPTWARPYRGTIPKAGTPCYMMIIDGEGNYVPFSVSNTDDGKTKYYTNFSAIQFDLSRSELKQILTTFGDPFVFFFGETPRVVQIKGQLLDTEDFDWYNEFWDNYNERLRGTKLAEMKARLFVGWNDIILQGYGLGLQVAERAGTPAQVMFTFTMFVVSETRINASRGNPVVKTLSSLAGSLEEIGETFGGFLNNAFSTGESDLGGPIQTSVDFASSMPNPYAAVVAIDRLSRVDRGYWKTADARAVFTVATNDWEVDGESSIEAIIPEGILP